MPLLAVERKPKNEDTRRKTASTKLTVSELTRVEDFVRPSGKSLGEFLRELIFREMNAAGAERHTDCTLQEIVGVQLLLMNVLKPLATGQPLTPAAFDNIVAEVHKMKNSVARRLTDEEI